MADIVLKNRDGQDVPYEGVNVLRVYTPEGNTELYHNGEIVTATIEPDFSEGNMVVDAGEGKFYSEVTIKKPGNLRPEVILKDENVAGIVGTLEPSSGGGDGGGGGAVAVSPSDINFYDYDGTIVAAWTLAELAAATELPENPEHDGLISQGWNWMLDDLKTTNRAMHVGQMYITDDGKTRLYVRVASELRATISLHISQTVANGVTIDWGDGSATQTLAGTGNVNTTHTYASIGDYVITLDPVDGCTLGFGNGDYDYCLFGAKGANNSVYLSMLKKVEIGSGVTSFADFAFQAIPSIESITIPAGVTTMGRTMFNNSRRLKCLTLPAGLTTIGNYFISGVGPVCVSLPKSLTNLGLRPFQTCSNIETLTVPDGVTTLSEYFIQNGYSLERIDIPDGVTSLELCCLYYCTNLPSITIPASVKSIATLAFGYCTGMKEYHFKRTTPPTLAKSDVFSQIPSDCIIYVPKGCLSAYKSATNWSTYASQMQEEAE